MSAIPLPCPERQRRVPPSFNWVDHRLVRDGHVRRCAPPALALYLVLLTVADKAGLSYYSDRSLAAMLRLPPGDLAAARAGLLTAGLIAYRAPVYQVLELGPAVPAEPVAGGHGGVAAAPVPGTPPPATAAEIAALLAAWRRQDGAA